MTIRQDVRDHFEREAVRLPAPAGLRAWTLAQARVARIERRNQQWIMGAVALLLAVALVAGLLAANSLRHGKVAPVPANVPRLLFHDNLAATASGRPVLLQVQGPPAIKHFELATTLPSTPATARVYAVDPNQAPALRAVNAAFGITTPAHEFGPILQYDPARGSIYFNQPSDGAQVRAEAITDQASAIRSAGDLLVRLGLFSRAEIDSMPASAIVYGVPVTWTVQFVRVLDGVPTYDWQGPPVWISIQTAGGAEELSFTRSSISGGEPATVIDAASAWQAVEQGHGYAFSGPGQAAPTSFRADRAEYCYFDSGGPWIVPMWCFRDTTTTRAAYPMWLFYPALTPGTFVWTAPTS